MSPQVITLTGAAIARIKHLTAQRGEKSVGIRVGVRDAGCSGMAYTVEFADERRPHDAVVEDGDVTVLIDPEAATYLSGAEMDYVEEKLYSGFVFNNPNEKGRCGCGESFYV